MDLTAFSLSSLALLAVPGPTNALIATAGATRGLARTLPLIGAALLGYLAAIIALRAGLGPHLTMHPALARALTLAAALYVLYLARVLWRGSRAAEETAATPLTFRRVALTTLLNPKAFVLALTSLPQDLSLVDLAPWLATLAAEISLVGGFWTAVGALLRAGEHWRTPTRHPSHLAERGSAVVLVAMAAALGARAITL